MRVDFQDSTTKHIFIVSSMIAFGMLVLVSVVLLTYYTASGDHVEPDSASQKRLDDLDEVMRSMLGNNWPVLLFVFALILILFLVFLYMLTRKQYDISDSSAQKLYTAFIVFTVIFSITMVVLGVRAFLSQRVDDKSGLNDYVPNKDKKKQNEMILGIIALGIFVLGASGGLIWYMVHKKHNTTVLEGFKKLFHRG